MAGSGHLSHNSNVTRSSTKLAGRETLLQYLLRGKSRLPIHRTGRDALKASRSGSNHQSETLQRPLSDPHSTRTSPWPSSANSVNTSSHQSSATPGLRQPNAFRVPGLPSEHRRSESSQSLGPEEQRLEMLVRRSRRRQRKSRTSTNSSRTWFPMPRSPMIRSKILSCALSAVVLSILTSIYLALTLSNVESQEFHVGFILIILVAGIVFCHSLVSLCVLATRSRGQNEEMLDISGMTGRGGYANPSRPIRVVLARDEEAAGMETATVKYPPPAYGLWRESVRVDPNRIFWQRNESQRSNPNAGEHDEETSGVQRPPSYISDDGIENIVSAMRRTNAPASEAPLVQAAVRADTLVERPIRS